MKEGEDGKGDAQEYSGLGDEDKRQKAPFTVMLVVTFTAGIA